MILYKALMRIWSNDMQFVYVICTPKINFSRVPKTQFNSNLQSKKAVTEYLVKDENTHIRHWWASSPMTSWGMRSGFWKMNFSEPCRYSLHITAALWVAVICRNIEAVITRRSWKLPSSVYVISWKPLILLGFSHHRMHFARSVSRSFLAIFLDLDCDFW